jgi:hypothetical protein
MRFSNKALQRLIDDINSHPVENLILSQGTVYGARYYTVEPIGGNWREMEDWLIQTYGTSSGSIWAQETDSQAPVVNERWYVNNRKFWFRNEKDRIMFVLRWS